MQVNRRISTRKPSAEGPATELVIDGLAFGGSGVAHVTHEAAARAVFVSRTAPGDRVMCDVDWSARPARGRVVRYLERSAERQLPPCSISEACGGCNWMHLTHDARLRGYAAFFARGLPEELGPVMPTVHASDAALGYRTRARFAVSASRRGLEIGYRRPESHDIQSTETCPVLEKDLEPSLTLLRDLLVAAEGRGEAQVALGAFDERDSKLPRLPVIDLAFTGSLPPSFFARAEEFVRERRLAGVRAKEGNATRPFSIGDPTPWVMGTDGPLRMAGFSQANDRATHALVKHVEALASAALAGKAKRNIVELYSGSGTFSVVLARIGQLVCVESDSAACAAARLNLAVRALVAKVMTTEAESHVVPRNIPLVVLDPPRTGASRVISTFAQTRPEHVIYVSCDPPTLLRDLAALSRAGYGLRSLDLFELFPQTSHVETVAHLARDRVA